MIYFKLSLESYETMIHFIAFLWSKEETSLDISDCIVEDARWNNWYSHFCLRLKENLS